MLACARLGAIHTVIFSGFSAAAMAERVNDIGAKIIITADGGYRHGKVIELKKITDEAAANCPSVKRIIVVMRTGIKILWDKRRDCWLHDCLNGANKFVKPVSVESSHPLYILYTSGTTGKPKGIVHSTGGYMVYNHATYNWAFNISEESIYWCTADVGWVTGHSSVVYGPLSHGAAIVIYEGAPDYPAIDRWWQIIEKYGVTIFYTSPTAIRLFMHHGQKWLSKYDLSSLELLGSVGEPINPEAWQWYYKHVGQERCPIVDTWWQTETGGFMISPAPGIEPIPLKPGSATLPLPGIEAAVVDAEGNEVEPCQTGYIIIKKPWPGMLLNIYRNSERYKKAYWDRFPGYYCSGDYAMKDSDGYFWLLGRADEVIKVAGHRLSTAEIESAVIAHPAVTEVAAISQPDEIKGEAIVLFVTLKKGQKPSDKLKIDISAYVRNSIGAIATPHQIFFVTPPPLTMRPLLRRPRGLTQP
jgi:acetyl-CoA synthetase